MNALEASAVELVSIADEVGCQFVCLFVQAPLPDLPFEPLPPAMVPELRARLDATGVTVSNVEFFPLTEDVDVESYRPAVELGAQIDGRRLVTVIDDTFEPRAAENLARLCDLAAEYRMDVGLEFMPLTPGCTSLESAVRLIHLAGAANAGFAADPLHLIRSGGSPDDLAAQPAELFGYAQICDGPDLAVTSDYIEEVFE